MYCYLYEGIQQSHPKLQYKPVVMTSSFFFCSLMGRNRAPAVWSQLSPPYNYSLRHSFISLCNKLLRV